MHDRSLLGFEILYLLDLTTTPCEQSTVFLALTFKSLRIAVIQSSRDRETWLLASIPPSISKLFLNMKQCRTFLCKQAFCMVSSSLSIISVSSMTSLLHISRKIKLASKSLLNLPTDNANLDFNFKCSCWIWTEVETTS